LLGGGGQHAVAHHFLERRVAGFGGVEQLGVDGGHLLAHAFDFVLVRGVPFHA
jgi:hypothetical protein